MRTSRWWMLTAVSTATFMLLLDVTVINVALPEIQRTLQASFFDLQWVIDAYALTLAAFLVTAGSLADQFGRRRVFLVGLAVFTAASLLCGVAADPLMLNLARAVQGVGGAIMYAVTPAMIANDFHGRQRGLAFGISGAVTGLAVAIGPLLGGALTAVSWRWVFLVNVPVGVLVAAVTALRVGESRDPNRHRVDWPGVLSFSAALIALVFALIRGEQLGWGSPLIIGLFISSAVLLAGFVAVERRHPTPMFDLRLFGNRSFNGLAVSTLLVNAAVYVAILFQVLYMQLILGFSAFDTGLRYLPLTATVFVAAAIAGSLCARLPARLLVGVGCAAVGAGLLLANGLTVESGWTQLLPGMVLTGFGIGLFNPARAYFAVALVPPARAGMSSGMSETFQQAGVAVGVAALGSLAHDRIRATFTDAITGSGAVPADTARSLSDLVSAGRFADAANAVPTQQQAAVLAATNQAFIDGLNAVLLAGGIIALIAAVVGAALMTNRDLHPEPAPDEPPAELAASTREA